ncbi:MAG: hypothetical protein RIS73_832 [Bacteroidota bacterium]|jgi:multisubunit Na+/H+ antiporter MnhE subunit
MEKQVWLLKQYIYFVPMIKLKLHLLFCFLLLTFFAVAQTETAPLFKGAVKGSRQKTYSNIVKNSIIKNLSLPLTDSTEENWEDAFYAMELINYKQLWIDEKIKMAFDNAEKRSAGFQRALMELVYTNYKNNFVASTAALLQKTENAKVFAMCAEYLLRSDEKKNYLKKIHLGLSAKNSIFKKDSISARIINELTYPILNAQDIINPKNKINLKILFANNILKNNVVVYSIQRKNRNNPGIVIVKDSNGNFITDNAGNIFAVTQLARSITNMPGYLTNGNTPQGIFRMHGFDISKSAAIGPTENIQLTMPFETSVQHFLKDSTIIDSVWTPKLYERLLPGVLKKQHSLFGTYYASAIGRTEIIAHGTTVDPEYYKGQTYYPFTPTQGCLCTKEIWSDVNGKRIISDQQKLVDAVKKAGGADGYLIVIEIDDQQKPVSINEILPYLKIKNK